MYYPIMLDLSCFRILVVGGGKVALGKVRQLLLCGGKVEVLSKHFCEGFKVLEGDIVCREGLYSIEILKGYTLIVAALNDKKYNDEIGEYCRLNNILCNVATNQALSSFIVPSSIHRGDLILSVSTSGKSPALSKKIKKELEEKYDESYAIYVNLLGEVRQLIKDTILEEGVRARALREVLNLNQEGLENYLLKLKSRL